MGLDVGSEINIQSIAGLEHLQAIPANNGPVRDGRRDGDIVKILANESFVKLHDKRGQGGSWKEWVSLLRKVTLIRTTLLMSTWTAHGRQ